MNSLQISELKVWKPSVLASGPTDDASLAAWLEQTKNVFLPFGTDLQLHILPLGTERKRHWLRNRKLNLVDIPYSNDSADARRFTDQLTRADAYLLGQAHGRQAAGQSLAKELALLLAKSNAETEIAVELDVFSHFYIKSVYNEAAKRKD